MKKKRNWKTTLIGVATAAANVGLAAASGRVSTRDALVSIGIAALGVVASDSRRDHAEDDQPNLLSQILNGGNNR